MSCGLYSEGLNLNTSGETDFQGWLQAFFLTNCEVKYPSVLQFFPRLYRNLGDNLSVYENLADFAVG